MAFNLRFTFAGMCLLVRDDDKQKLHVLMPPTGRNSHRSQHGIDEHFVRLRYDIQHERPTENTNKYKGVARFTDIKMEHGLIDLSGITGTPDLNYRPDIVDLQPVTNQPISRTLLEGHNPGDKVLSRVTLAAGSIGRYDRGGRWKLDENIPDKDAKYMAISVTWTIPGIDQEVLELEIKALNDEREPESERKTLYPIGGTIDLSVLHTPEPELRPCPPTGMPDKHQEAKHFKAYYDLFNLNGSHSRPTPIFVDAGQPVEPEDKNRTVRGPVQILGSQVTCILATAEAEPG